MKYILLLTKKKFWIHFSVQKNYDHQESQGGITSTLNGEKNKNKNNFHMSIVFFSIQ